MSVLCFADEGLDGKYWAGKVDFFNSRKISIYLEANSGLDHRGSSFHDGVGQRWDVQSHMVAPVTPQGSS